MCVSPASKLLLPLSLLMAFLLAVNLLAAPEWRRRFCISAALFPHKLPSCLNSLCCLFLHQRGLWTENLLNLTVNSVRHNINLSVMYSICKWRICSTNTSLLWVCAARLQRGTQIWAWDLRLQILSGDYWSAGQINHLTAVLLRIKTWTAANEWKLQKEMKVCRTENVFC